MRRLTASERQSVVDDFYTEAGDDLVGLWEIAKVVEGIVGSGVEAREQTLMIVTDLLAKGLVAGDPPYARGGYNAWAEQNSNEVVARIRSEWISLGHTPNIPDIAWFARRA